MTTNSTVAKLSHFLHSKRLPNIHIRTGNTIRVHQRVVEGKRERLQVFEGLVIATKGKNDPIKQSVVVRKITQGIGVEKIFPLASPLLEKIEIVKKAKVRRSKLYYMRKRTGKKARMSERHISSQQEGAVVQMGDAPETTASTEATPATPSEEKDPVVSEQTTTATEAPTVSEEPSAPAAPKISAEKPDAPAAPKVSAEKPAEPVDKPADSKQPDQPADSGSTDA